MNSKAPTDKKNVLPPEAIDALSSQLASLDDPELEGGVRGRYCYVLHSGQPLCRLGYRGDNDVWDFAIYKFSSGRYSSAEPFFPRHGTITDLITTALQAYNLG